MGRGKVAAIRPGVLGMRNAFVLAILVLAATGASPARAANSKCFVYSGGVVSVLPTLGGLRCQPRDINDAGQVVGWSQLLPGQGDHAFVANGGVLTDLGTLGGDESIAVKINELGVIAGESLNADGRRRAFRYSGGTMTDLGVLPGDEASQAVDINDAGQIVGVSYVYLEPYRSFLYDAGMMIDLGSLGGGDTRVADINASGQITGSSKNAGGVTRAFLYESGSMTDLGTLGGSRSVATAINDAGQVVGWSDTADGGQHAFLYESGTMNDLGDLDPGQNYSAAWSVNASGQVVGRSDVGFTVHGFLSDSGPMTDLGIGFPFAINDAGVVAIARGNDIVLYDGGITTTIPLIPGAYESLGYGLNSAGEVAGYFIGEFCPDEPLPTCLAAERSSLRIDEGSTDAKDLFQWKWSEGPAIDGSELHGGDTLLCLYDTTSGAYSEVARFRLVSYLGWDTQGNGMIWVDRDGNDDGARKLRLKFGDDGRTSVAFTAKGEAVPMPVPVSGTEMLDQDPSVVIQLYQDLADICWTSEFTIAGRNEPEEFKAKVP